MHAFEVPVKPMAFRRARSRGAQRFDDAAYAVWKEQVGWHLKAAMTRDGVQRFDGPLSVGLVVGVESLVVWVRASAEPRPSALKGDLDNYVKAVLDAINKVLFDDDGQVVTIAARFIDEDRETLLAHTMVGVAENNLAADRAWLQGEGIDADG